MLQKVFIPGKYEKSVCECSFEFVGSAQQIYSDIAAPPTLTTVNMEIKPKLENIFYFKEHCFPAHCRSTFGANIGHIEP